MQSSAKSFSLVSHKADTFSVKIYTPATFKKGSLKSSTTVKKAYRQKDFKLAASDQSISVTEQLSENLKGLIDSIGKALQNMMSPMAQPIEEDKQVTEARVPLGDAVLVFGSTGRTGKFLIKELLDAGREVVATVRRAEKLNGLITELGENENLYIRTDVDMTNKDTISKSLFTGVSQIILCTGPSFGTVPGGGFGFIDDMTPERVDLQGVVNIVNMASEYLPKQQEVIEEVLDMKGEKNLSLWESLDDVIMGGRSSSKLQPSAAGAIFTGDLIFQDGGFCSVRTKDVKFDLSKFDGIRMRVKGNGQTYKFLLRTSDIESPSNEFAFQACFETKPGDEWTEVRLPWHEFVYVIRGTTQRQQKKLDPSKVTRFGLILSRFAFNGNPNLSCKPGQFELELESGIYGFKNSKPSIVMLSSGAVERNALLGDDEELRQLEIPIVKLNPGNILNYKYKGENYLRNSGLPYAIVRAVGLVEKDYEGSVLVEASQGDEISGRNTRENVAKVLTATVNSPFSCYKTFEIRDGLGPEAKGKEMDEARYIKMFLSLKKDIDREKYGIRSFPPYFPPKTETNKKEQ